MSDANKPAPTTETSGARDDAARRPDVACFVPELLDGGAQRAAVKLVGGMVERGVAVDLVLAARVGPHLADVDARVRVVDLRAGRVTRSVLPLARYLARARPRALVSFLSHANLAAVAARSLARSSARLVLVEQNTVSAARGGVGRDRLLPALVRRAYTRAEAVVGVSEGVARDLVENSRLPAGKVSVIPNPVVDAALAESAAAPLEEPWFAEGSPPVFLSAGRLTEQKDFTTLLRAFALLRESRAARLLILGEGAERARLEKLAAELSLGTDVSLPGFVANPYARMSRAAAFVLSSRWEGLPTVLIEALACGCPVVSTDCPSGPREILDGGVYGALVPVGDAVAMRDAMAGALDSRPPAQALKGRAELYSVERAVTLYLELLGIGCK